MIQCKYCNAENTGKSRFCIACGGALNMGSQPSPVNEKAATETAPTPALSTENAGSTHTPRFMDDRPSATPGGNSTLVKYIFGGLAAVAVCVGAFLVLKEVAAEPDEVKVLDASTTEASGLAPIDTTSSVYSPEAGGNTSETGTSSTSISPDNSEDNTALPTEGQTGTEEETTTTETTTSEFQPEEAIFSFVGADTWYGQITYSADATTYDFQLKAGYRRLRMETPAFHCPTALTYKSFVQAEGDYISFVFDEKRIDAASECETGPVGITASPSKPNQLYLQFFDAEGALIAKGYLYRN